eukprot:585131-Hanusia_phi.AAC.4
MARIRVVLGERSRMKLMLKKYCKHNVTKKLMGLEEMTNEELRKFIDDLKVRSRVLVRADLYCEIDDDTGNTLHAVECNGIEESLRKPAARST